MTSGTVPLRDHPGHVTSSDGPAGFSGLRRTEGATLDKGTKLAITGASGFLGSHVMRALVKTPVELTAVTRHAGRLSGFGDRVRVVELDLHKPGQRAFERLGRPDILLHLAWDGLPNYRLARHYEVELPAQYNFLKGLVSDGLRSLLVTGTCFEYGCQSGPLSEHLPCLPSTAYGYAKDALHRQLVFLKGGTPFRLTWARVFYLFGEGQGENSLWSLLGQALNRGDTRFPMSGGEQLRDFLPVAEVATLLVRLAASQQDVGAINVCSGRPRSVRGLVEEWLRQRGRTIELDLARYPYPDYEPMAFWGDPGYLNAIVNRRDRESP